MKHTITQLKEFDGERIFIEIIFEFKVKDKDEVRKFSVQKWLDKNPQDFNSLPEDIKSQFTKKKFDDDEKVRSDIHKIDIAKIKNSSDEDTDSVIDGIINDTLRDYKKIGIINELHEYIPSPEEVKVKETFETAKDLNYKGKYKQDE